MKWIFQICETLQISRATVYNYLRHEAIPIGKEKEEPPQSPTLHFDARPPLANLRRCLVSAEQISALFKFGPVLLLGQNNRSAIPRVRRAKREKLNQKGHHYALRLDLDAEQHSFEMQADEMAEEAAISLSQEPRCAPAPCLFPAATSASARYRDV